MDNALKLDAKGLAEIYYGTSNLSPQKPTTIDKKVREVHTSTVAFTTNKTTRMDIIALNIVCVFIFIYLLNNVFTNISTIKNPDLKQLLHKYNMLSIILLLALNVLFLCNKYNLTYVLVMNIIVYIGMTYYINRNLE